MCIPTQKTCGARKVTEEAMSTRKKMAMVRMNACHGPGNSQWPRLPGFPFSDVIKRRICCSAQKCCHQNYPVQLPPSVGCQPSGQSPRQQQRQEVHYLICAGLIVDRKLRDKLRNCIQIGAWKHGLSVSNWKTANKTKQRNSCPHPEQTLHNQQKHAAITHLNSSQLVLTNPTKTMGRLASALHRCRKYMSVHDFCGVFTILTSVVYSLYLQ